MTKKLFKINDRIDVVLEEDKIKIFVTGEEFMICKGIAIQISYGELDEMRDFSSIDDLVSNYYEIIEKNGNVNEQQITLETEFFVHCSNLQVWAENGYDTRLDVDDLIIYGNAEIISEKPELIIKPKLILQIKNRLNYFLLSKQLDEKDYR